MQRKITVFAPWLEADLRQRIVDRVQKTGLKVAFFDREAEERRYLHRPAGAPHGGINCDICRFGLGCSR